MEKTAVHKRSLNWLLIGLAIAFGSVLLPTNLKAISIFVLAALVLTHCVANRFYFNKSFFISSGIFYIALVATLIYTENLSEGVKTLSMMSSLLVFPLLFSLTPPETLEFLRAKRKHLMWVYILGVILFNVIPFLWLWATHYSGEELIKHYATVVRVDFGKWSIHPIYLSMHNSVAILFSFFIIVKSRQKEIIAALLAIDIVLVLFLLLYAKKGPIIALVLILGLALVFQRNKRLFKPFLLATLFLVGLTVVIPKTRNKFVELVKIENVTSGNVTSTNIRYSIYKTAYNLFLDAPIIGYGVGDTKEKLINSYEKEGNDLLYEGRYNSHNQYLGFLLMGGIILFGMFLIFFFLNGVVAIRYDNQILLLLLIFYGVVMFTENILQRESGVLYFSLFISYFSLFNFQEIKDK